MSNLEDKLSASIQTQRRRPGTNKPGGGEKGEAAPPAEKPRDQKARPQEDDLNAGGGRSPNPPRIWPD